MTKFTIYINGESKKVKVDEDTPLLWVIRDELELTGTKFGCGKGLCGACTIHVNGIETRSCQTPIDFLEEGDEITTIEGLSKDSFHPVQKAWVQHDVPQCGYCQSGQILAASALLSENLNPSDEDIDEKITNLCRCGTYVRVRKAIRKSAELMKHQKN